jgi:4-hydroxymandelate oxidase
MSRGSLTRRRAIAAYGSLLAASPLLKGQAKLIGEASGRIAPVEELVNSLEFEPMAERKLDRAHFAEIAGSDRKAFDRMTFRPRMMVNSLKMDLTQHIFGDALYMPFAIAPAPDQKRYHPDGELAMVRGASAARTVTVVTSRASFPIEQIAAEAKQSSLWFQVSPHQGDRAAVDAAVKAGCKAVIFTPNKGTAVDWAVVERLRKGLSVPFLLKGVMTPDEAKTALGKSVQGIVVSNWGTRSTVAPIEVLPAIADTVAGKMPILIDGSFRRGSDIIKGLALGAQVVLLGRPPLWGLAAYGDAGVSTLLGLLQNELARNMAQVGRVNLGELDRTVVRIHKR